VSIDKYINHPQKSLILTLKIKHLNKKLDEAIEWNFGYCPSDNVYFDRDLEERNALIELNRSEE